MLGILSPSKYQKNVKWIQLHGMIVTKNGGIVSKRYLINEMKMSLTWKSKGARKRMPDLVKRRYKMKCNVYYAVHCIKLTEAKKNC